MSRRVSVPPALYRRELLLAAVLVPALSLSGLGVVRLLADAVAVPPRGLSYHALYVAGDAVGLAPAQTRAFAPAILLGLFAVVAADDYHRVHGVVLLLLAVVGSGLLARRGVLVVDWAARLPAVAAGVTVGVAAGSLRVRRGVDGGETDGRRGDTAAARLVTVDTRRGLARTFWLLAAVAVVALGEATLVYESPLRFRGGAALGVTPFVSVDAVVAPVRVRGVDAAAFARAAPAVGVFLAGLGVFRSHTADRDVVLLGASGSGKTTAAAGLALAVGDGPGVTVREPLATLRDRLRDRRQFPSTGNERVYPLSFDYRHGRLFPRKVTVRTLDYAGDHVADLRPPAPDREPVTADADEAFAVARYLHAAADGDDDPPGVDPTTVDGLADRDGRERVATLLADVVTHADSVGLVYPLDDFAGPAVREGDLPPYARVADGEVVDPRPRADYREALAATAETVSDPFVAATKADYVAASFDRERGRSHRDDWAAFGDHVADRFLGDAVPPAVTDVVPLYFEIDADAPPEPGEPLPVVTDGDEPLRGAGALLDRLGRSGLWTAVTDRRRLWAWLTDRSRLLARLEDRT